MRKPAIFLLIISFLFASVYPYQALAASSFSDINSNWAKESILRLSSLGYVNGYPDGKFKPDSTMTRAEFTSALVTCLGISKTDTSATSFSDIEKHWAQASINAAVNQGVLKPKEFYQNMFKPNEKIKRCEVAAMLVRALGQKADTGTLPPFEDKAVIEKNGYRGYIKTAFDLGLMSGYPGGKFDPNGNMTRAQVCSVLSTFLDKKGGTTPSVSTPVQTTGNGGITAIAVGDELFNLGSRQITFRTGTEDIVVASLSTNTGYVVVNGKYPFKLETSTSNPDISVNNLRYKINRLSINGDKLIAYPEYSTIDLVSISAHKYYADYVKLYINSANSINYLSDMQLLDKQTVKIGDKTYNLSQDKITLELGKDFFDVKSIIYDTNETTLQLSITDPVIKEGLTVNDISAIFVGTTTLNLKSISSVSFIINSSRYNLSNIIIDANCNFTIDQKSVSPANVTMIVDSMAYKISNIQYNKNKFVFYCSESTTNNWVVINDVYRDVKDVQIIKDNVSYSLDQIKVISLNLVRIGSKQYNLDSSFKCRFDNKVYDISRIEYDSTLQADVLRVSASSTDSYLTNQPINYVFYRNNSKYLEGLNNTVLVKAGGSWITFSKVIVSDPSHFTYNGSSYDLINAQIRINSLDFVVSDTVWHGRTQILDLYIN